MVNSGDFSGGTFAARSTLADTMGMVKVRGIAE
jgi:hypothetical protein